VYNSLDELDGIIEKLWG
ncbi:MAG: hypothetical protein ACO39V_02155, partial [Arenicellales bacterium]